MRAFIFLLQFLAFGVCVRAAEAAGPAQAAPVTVTTNSASAPRTSVKPGFKLRSAQIVTDVERLTQSGTDPGVVNAFIQTWSSPYSVSADDILHLHEIGVPSEVLTTLLRHGGELGARFAPNAPAPPPVLSTAPVPATAPTAPAMAPYPELAPGAPAYAEPGYAYSYPVYVPYSVPSYSYSYSSWPLLWPSFGFYGYYPHHYRGFYDRGHFGRSYPVRSYGHSFGGRPVVGVHPIAGGPSWGGGRTSTRNLIAGGPSWGGGRTSSRNVIAGGPSWGAGRSFSGSGFARGSSSRGSFSGRGGSHR